MAKLKRSPKKLELDIHVAKSGQFCVFFAASSKFRGKRRIPRHGVKIRVPRSTARAAYHLRKLALSRLLLLLIVGVCSVYLPLWQICEWIPSSVRSSSELPAVLRHRAPLVPALACPVRLVSCWSAPPCASCSRTCCWSRTWTFQWTLRAGSYHADVDSPCTASCL